MIRAYLDQDHKKWDLYLDDFRFAYNTAKHSVTNMTPAFLNLGRELEPRTSLLQQFEQGAEVVPSTTPGLDREIGESEEHSGLGYSEPTKLP